MDEFSGVVALAVFLLTGIILYLILQSWLSALFLPFWAP